MPRIIYAKRAARHKVLLSRVPMSEPFPFGRYRHFKGGEYEVLGIAHHSETLEPHVVYRALYGEGGLWVRPLVMFLEHVTRDGVTRPRFEYVGPMPME